MARHYDAIVLGCGVMGAAAAAELARRGARALVLERGAIPNAEGSSGGLSRFFRTAYFERDEYVPLLQRALAGWRRLEAETGRELLRLTGALYLGDRRPGGFIERTGGAAERFGLAHELLEAPAIRTRFQQVRAPDGWTGIIERDAGTLLPEAAVAAMADIALRNGAELRAHVTAHDWRATAREVQVRSSAGDFSAGHLVLCAGPWTGRLCADLGAPLAVTRQTAAWFWPLLPQRFEPGPMLPWAVECTAGAEAIIQYGFPLQPEAPGVKTAMHRPGPLVNPDDGARLRASAADAEALRPALQRFLPDADGPLMAIRPCMYTNSPDGHCILGRHPGCDRLTLACGFSGHGFKFAPVVGEVVADCALAGATDLPVAFMAPGRFEP